MSTISKVAERAGVSRTTVSHVINHADRVSKELRDRVNAAIEALSDFQLASFRMDPANKGKVMDKGLWGWSRHPNYFFEWMGWLAYPAIALSLAQPASLLSFGAPIRLCPSRTSERWKQSWTRRRRPARCSSRTARPRRRRIGSSANIL